MRIRWEINKVTCLVCINVVMAGLGFAERNIDVYQAPRHLRRMTGGIRGGAAFATTSLSIRLVGVTPTQAVLQFKPPLTSTVGCQLKVTATKSVGKWDFSTLVPDTNP